MPAIDGVLRRRVEVKLLERAKQSTIKAFFWATRLVMPQVRQGGFQPLDSRATLLRRFAKYETRFALTSVPRPEFWGGYRIEPQRMEFWFDQPHRLHDRRLYERQISGWRMTRLFP